MGGTPDTVTVAAGFMFGDALSSGPLFYLVGSSIALVEGVTLSQ